MALEQRAGDEADSGEPADRGARLGDRARGGRQVEIDQLRRAAAIGEVLAQHHHRVAGAAAGDQRPEGLPEVAAAAEDVVIDLQQMAGMALEQPRLLLLRVAQGIGKGLVLLAQQVGHAPSLSTSFPATRRSRSAASAAVASDSGRSAGAGGARRPAACQAKSSAKAAGSIAGRCLR